MYKSCFITIIGKPNAGKSTLLNAIIGEKVSIVSWRPQTTRNIITGILHGEDFQIIFLDTPGIQSGKSILGEYMSKSVRRASDDTDAILYVVDGARAVDEDEFRLIEKYSRSKIPVILAVNKVDEADKERFVNNLKRFGEFPKLHYIVPLSAKRGDNLDVLLEQLKAFLKPGEKYYGEELFTDKDLRFMAAEAIREKALFFLQDEIPHGLGVNITRYEVRPDGRVTDVEAELILSKNSHKPIVIGKGGAMLKRIGEAARKDIEKMSDEKVFLKIFVKIREDWQNNFNISRDLGYDKKNI